MHGGEAFTAFLPLMLFAIPFAIGNYFVAGRMGRNKAVWVVLTLIPFVNFVFMYYVIYAVVLYMLDRLNGIAGGPRNADAA
ncbi:MAG: hypothetical protein ACPGQ5_03905 [Alphaproteobacteria bacterium]